MSELQNAIDTAPAGTSGLVCEPWTPGEVYGVAANWAEASSPVRCWCGGEWSTDEQGRQVADFRHSPEAALAAILAESIRLTADSDDAAEAEAYRLVSDAVEF